MPKDITKIKQIRLIASDFNDVNSKVLTHNQYCNNSDCPIYRALKRQGVDLRAVGREFVLLNYIREHNSSIEIKGQYEDVERCRLSLVNGAKYAVIKAN